MDIILMLVVIALYGLSIGGGKSGKYLFLTAIVAHVAYIALRWRLLGRVPVTERHDILIMMALLTACGFPYFLKRIPLATLLNVLPVFVIILCFFGVFQDRVDTIEPNMNTLWFPLYMTLFIAGYGMLTLGAVAGIFFLFVRNESYERMQHRIVLLGWVMFSFALVAGSVWFYRVYGVYWLWTAKELWTTVTWFYFSFYLHARLTNTLRGRLAAGVGVLGFGVMLFSYIGVTPILGSPWTQF